MKVCIDPGRGGKDTGRNAGKVLEKNLTLGFASVLAEQLKKKKITAVQTRQDDTDMSNALRASFAHASGADLLISIHCSGDSEKTRRGVFVGRYWPKNQPLADVISKKLKCASGFDESEILRKCDIPCVVIRIGYITNPHEVKKMLVDEDHLTGMATLIAEAVKTYGSK